MPLWARVGDGDGAFRQLNSLFQRKTLPNLFDLCGPFQIDGNLGTTAGIAEMLLQSHEVGNHEGKSEVRIINLLPALPKVWLTGSVSGLCARGGFEVDITWQNGLLTHAVIHSKLGNSCLLCWGKRALLVATEPGHTYVFDGQLTQINKSK